MVPLYFVCGLPVRDVVRLMAAKKIFFSKMFFDNSIKNIILYRTVEKKLKKSFGFAAISVATSRTGSPHTKYKGTTGTPNILKKVTLSTDRYYFWNLRPSGGGSPLIAPV